jgi:hypothetical protein
MSAMSARGGRGEEVTHIYLGIVFRITSMHGNGLQIKTTPKVDGSDDVPAGSETVER